MVKFTFEIDHIKTTVENSQQGIASVNWHTLMDMMLGALGSVGVHPEAEAILDYFDIVDDVTEEGEEV
jgi:hypothetical protein